VSRIVDLTQPVSPRTPRSVDHPQVEFKVLRDFSTHGLIARTVNMSLHAGTHVDYPALYFQGGKDTDAYPISRFIGPGVILDLPRDDWGVITGDDLETATPKVERGDIVMLHTGWHRYYYTDPDRYQYKHPGCDKSAVDWLVERGVSIVVGESPSAEHFFMHIGRFRETRGDVIGDPQFDLDQFPPHYFHKKLMEHDILIIDGAGGDADEIAGRRCTIGVMPSRFEAVEAAPARVFAILD
jgi:kynurenine formamidase